MSATQPSSVDYAQLIADARFLMDFWNDKLELFEAKNPSQDQLKDVRIPLKHFLSDMYSLLNYMALARHIVKTKEANINFRKVYVDWKSFDDNFSFRALGGKDALRNILEHRQLVEVTSMPDPSLNISDLFPQNADRYYNCRWIEDQIKNSQEKYTPKMLSVRVRGIMGATMSIFDDYLKSINQGTTGIDTGCFA